MKLINLSLGVICCLFSCKKDKVLDTFQAEDLVGKTFNSTVLIDGHTYDGFVVKNCIFENIDGDALQLRDVNNLLIEDCIFRNITGNAIRFRNSGTSDGVVIRNNKIHTITENGILAPEQHINTLIQGNSIYNVATSNTSSQFGSPHHGIYFQGANVTMLENVIYDVLNNQGNCISIRTYGTISKNKLYGAKDHGISYFSDHPGEGKILLIENNMIYDNGKRGINLASNGTSENHIGRALIRFNTIISSSESPIGINDALTGVTVDVFANITVRTDGGATFIFSALPFNQSHNITSNGDVGFVDFLNRNLHLINSSIAKGAAAGIVDFPLTDWDGDTRLAPNLDVGADEIE